MAAGLMRGRLVMLLAMLALAGCPASDETADIDGSGAMDQLTDTRWQLMRLQGEAAVGTPWIRFRTPDLVDGSAGCNTFSGSYLQQGKRFELQRLAMTKRHCPDSALMEQESSLLRSLQAVESFAMEDAALVLIDSTGTRLEFSAAAATE